MSYCGFYFALLLMRWRFILLNPFCMCSLFALPLMRLRFVLPNPFCMCSLFCLTLYAFASGLYFA